MLLWAYTEVLMIEIESEGPKIGGWIYAVMRL